MKRTMPRQQRGVTLVTALIMLILLTLMVLASANLGNSSLQAVGNMQQRSDVYAAAQEAVETALSKTDFYKTPDSPISDQCNSAVNTRCVDTNGDGVTDVTVTLGTTTCVTAQPYIPPNPADMQEVTCAQEQDQTSLSTEQKQVNSACWDTVWELRALAKDVTTNATVTYVQGVAVPVSGADVPGACMPS